MGKRKKILLKIEDKRRFIAQHQAKIDLELMKPNPDQALVRHWQSEIRGARRSIANCERRLQALGWKI
jgi:hypothetical protein